jgi:hypothetical protein
MRRAICLLASVAVVLTSILGQDYNVPFRPRLGGPPTVRAIGAISGGSGAINPGLPAGTVADDLLIMVLETSDEAITVSGWTEAPSSPQTPLAGATRLTVFYKTAVGGDATTTSDSGNHQIGRVIGITAGTWATSGTFNVSAAGTAVVGTTSVSVPGATTTVDNCLVIAMATGDLPDSTSTNEFNTPANASLTGVTLQIADSHNTGSGNGGAIMAITGVEATAGTYDATTATAVTSAVRGYISLAVAPVPI